ncbi:hypothetical protein FA13DRAFT_1733625 [Coprinellus micaceus]|uniref:Uncharacterized protein n=1 Tax=Coprinellus micaceus TaxID=71717 RepID=A0A4Y7T834_COPMI|nr:hypothetical protein FA13DRAFT_1745080 [Coprinellus micaceus]TEB30323.1 hypothetical protein FA13DRAFT_1733625 [Coprinellus micaceus]
MTGAVLQGLRWAQSPGHTNPEVTTNGLATWKNLIKAHHSLTSRQKAMARSPIFSLIDCAL